MLIQKAKKDAKEWKEEPRLLENRSIDSGLPDIPFEKMNDSAASVSESNDYSPINDKESDKSHDNSF